MASAVALLAVSGCGSSSSSSNGKSTGGTNASHAKAGQQVIDPALKRDLGQADAGQMKRAQAYLNCLGPKLNTSRLTIREGTAKGPPTIIGSLKRGTQFGIGLASSPAGAKTFADKLRASGSKAIYTHGSTVMQVGGSNPSKDEITFTITCADKIG
jgi:hypothetical protein